MGMGTGVLSESYFKLIAAVLTKETVTIKVKCHKYL